MNCGCFASYLLFSSARPTLKCIFVNKHLAGSLRSNKMAPEEHWATLLLDNSCSFIKSFLLIPKPFSTEQLAGYSRYCQNRLKRFSEDGVAHAQTHIIVQIS